MGLLIDHQQDDHYDEGPEFRAASIRYGSTKSLDLHHGGHLIGRKICGDVDEEQPIQWDRFDKQVSPLQQGFFRPT